MPLSSHKSDEYPLPKYRQGESSSKVGYFKVAHTKIGSEKLFQDFLKMYKQAILPKVCVKRVKKDNIYEPCIEAAKPGKKAIKFYPYSFMLGYFPCHDSFKM